MDIFDTQIFDVLPKIRSYSRTFFGKTEYHPEDIVQETIARAYASRHTFTPGSNMYGWLKCIMRTRFIDMWHEHKATRRIFVHLEEFYLRKFIGMNGNQESHIELQNVRTAILKLPLRTQKLLSLAERGSSTEEIITAMHYPPDMPRSTVKIRMYRARRALQKELQKTSEQPT